MKQRTANFNRQLRTRNVDDGCIMGNSRITTRMSGKKNRRKDMCRYLKNAGCHRDTSWNTKPPARTNGTMAIGEKLEDACV